MAYNTLQLFTIFQAIELHTVCEWCSVCEVPKNNRVNLSQIRSFMLCYEDLFILLICFHFLPRRVQVQEILVSSSPSSQVSWSRSNRSHNHPNGSSSCSETSGCTSCCSGLGSRGQLSGPSSGMRVWRRYLLSLQYCSVRVISGNSCMDWPWRMTKFLKV